MPRVVLITGGSSGIGRSIGEYLSGKDFIVYGTSRNPEKYNDSFPFSLLKMDVISQDSISETIAHILSKEKSLDIVINNAGVGITGPIEETPEKEIRNAFETNFYGPISVIKAVLPQMRLQRSGMIINITSIAGYMGLPYRGIYSATKAALEIATESLRMEVKQFGINLTNIAPGDFATNIAAGRYHSPVLENSPYKDIYEKTLTMMNDHVNEGEDPIKMAEAVYQVINSSNPRVRYKVGALLQQFSIILKRILPSKLYEKMLMRHYGLK